MYKFPLTENEIILRKDLASMSIENQAYNGALYLTNERIVFVGYIMDIRNKYIEEILFYNINEILPVNSLLIFANALLVKTSTERSLRFVVKDRDGWIADIKRKMNEFTQF